MFEDLDGDGKITSYDRKRCDLTPVPEIVFGANFDATWRNLDFSLLLQGQARARVLLFPTHGSGLRKHRERGGSERMDSGRPDRKPSENRFHGQQRRCEQSVILLPQRSLPSTEECRNRLHHSRQHPVQQNENKESALLHRRLHNLLTFSGLKNVDPETSDESYQTYPQMRIFNTGVKLTF